MTPEEVRGVKFRETFRGYSSRAVNSLLEHLAIQIERGNPLQPTFEAGTPFPRALRGYSVDDVDRFLAALW